MWMSQLRKANYAHFLHKNLASPDTCVAFTELPRRVFAHRVTVLGACSGGLYAFSSSIRMEVDDAPEAAQMELVELECSAAITVP